MQHIQLKTFDDKYNTVTVWDEVENAIGAVVIAHGMAEHADRYDDFAKFLNKAGYIVLADNHRGHKFNPDGDLGKVAPDSFENSVKDIKAVVDYAKETYAAEVLLFGHSYGSFLSQRYLELYADTLKGCVLSGTAYMRGALVGMGKAVAAVQRLFIGGNKTGKLIDKLSFGAYNKPFVSQGQRFAWLSRDREKVAEYEADEYCGYPLSIDYYYYFFRSIQKMYGDRAKAIPKDMPILIAIGSDDPVSNKGVLAEKLYKYYLQYGLNVEYKCYPGARHEILNETNRQEVYADMEAFIDKAFDHR